MIKNVSAVIFAAGKGTRIGILTKYIPKPLLPLGKITIIDYTIKKFIKEGFFNINVTIHYMKKKFINHFKYNDHVFLLKQNKNLGTAGALSLLQDTNKYVIAIFGDILTTTSFKKLLDYHIKNKNDITIATKKEPINNDFGIIIKDSKNNIKSYKNKNEYFSFLDSGIYVFNKDILCMLEYNKYIDMPDLLKKCFLSKKKIKCFVIKNYWIDTGTMEKYTQARIDYKNRLV